MECSCWADFPRGMNLMAFLPQWYQDQFVEWVLSGAYQRGESPAFVCPHGVPAA